MNVDRIATMFVGGVIMVTALTTIFGRSNSPRVFDALGRAVSSTISAALGKGVRSLA